MASFAKSKVVRFSDKVYDSGLGPGDYNPALPASTGLGGAVSLGFTSHKRVVDNITREEPHEDGDHSSASASGLPHRRSSVGAGRTLPPQRHSSRLASVELKLRNKQLAKCTEHVEELESKLLGMREERGRLLRKEHQARVEAAKAERLVASACADRDLLAKRCATAEQKAKDQLDQVKLLRESQAEVQSLRLVHEKLLQSTEAELGSLHSAKEDLERDNSRLSSQVAETRRGESEKAKQVHDLEITVSRLEEEVCELIKVEGSLKAAASERDTREADLRQRMLELEVTKSDFHRELLTTREREEKSEHAALQALEDKTEARKALADTQRKNDALHKILEENTRKLDAAIASAELQQTLCRRLQSESSDLHERLRDSEATVASDREAATANLKKVKEDASRRLMDVTMELERAREWIGQAEVEGIRLTESLKASEQATFASQAEVVRLVQRVEKLLRQVAELQDCLHQAKSTVKEISVRATTAETETSELTLLLDKEHETAETKARGFQEAKNELEDLVKRLTKELEVDSKGRRKADKERERMHGRTVELIMELQEANEERSRLGIRVFSLEQDAQKAAEGRERTRILALKLENELREWELERAVLHGRVTELEEKLREAEGELGSRESGLSDAERCIAEMQQQLYLGEERQKELESDLTTSTDQLLDSGLRLSVSLATADALSEQCATLEREILVEGERIGSLEADLYAAQELSLELESLLARTGVINEVMDTVGVPVASESGQVVERATISELEVAPTSPWLRSRMGACPVDVVSLRLELRAESARREGLEADLAWALLSREELRAARDAMADMVGGELKAFGETLSRDVCSEGGDANDEEHVVWLERQLREALGAVSRREDDVAVEQTGRLRSEEESTLWRQQVATEVQEEQKQKQEQVGTEMASGAALVAEKERSRALKERVQFLEKEVEQAQKEARQEVIRVREEEAARELSKDLQRAQTGEGFARREAGLARRHVRRLAQENASLAGHNNTKQKIRHLESLKLQSIRLVNLNTNLSEELVLATKALEVVGVLPKEKRGSGAACHAQDGGEDASDPLLRAARGSVRVSSHCDTDKAALGSALERDDTEDKLKVTRSKERNRLRACKGRGFAVHNTEAAVSASRQPLERRKGDQEDSFSPTTPRSKRPRIALRERLLNALNSSLVLSHRSANQEEEGVWEEDGACGTVLGAGMRAGHGLVVSKSDSRIDGLGLVPAVGGGSCLCNEDLREELKRLLAVGVQHGASVGLGDENT